MKYLALLVALFVVAAGVGGLVVPHDRVFEFGRVVLTTGGLVAIAVLRICLGMVLIWAAPGSRAPKVLQVFGAILLLAGLVTPLVGVERSRALLEWEAAQGAMFLRIGAAVVVGLGGWLAFVLVPRSTGRQP